MMAKPKSFFAMCAERARILASKNPDFEVTLSTTIKSGDTFPKVQMTTTKKRKKKRVKGIQ